MVQSARVECFDHVTSSKQRKVQFVDSLKLVAEHSLQTSNPEFYIETCKLILEIQDLLGMEEKTSETLFDYGMFLFGQGDYSGAKDALRNAIKGFNSSRPSFVGQCHFQLGVINSHMENFQEALVSFQEALECKNIMFGKGNMSTAICHHWLGYVYHRKQDIDKALETQSIALREMEESTADITTGSFISDSCFELGCIYHEKGELKKSVELHQRSLLIREEQVAEFKPKLQSYIRLAMALMSDKLKRPHSTKENTDLTSQIVCLLNKAVVLCTEQFQHGNLRDRFPVIMIAHTDRLQSIKDLLSLAVNLCTNLTPVLMVEETKDGKQKTEKLKTEFRNLLGTFLDENELGQTSDSAAGDGQTRYELECCWLLAEL